MRTLALGFPSFARRRYLFLLVLLGTTVPLLAQITSVSPDQTPPIPGSGYDYIHSASETVDPQTGALSFHLNTAMPSGLDITVPFAFEYNSGSALHHVQVLGGWTDNSSYLGRGGWSYAVPTLAEAGGTFFVNQGGGGNTPCHYFNQYIFSDLNGTPRDMRLQIYDTQAACYPPSLTRPFLAGSDGVFGAITTQLNFNQATQCR